MSSFQVAKRLSVLILGLLPVILALGFTTLLLIAVGASPGEAYGDMLQGALGSVERVADVLVAWAPLLLCSAGLLIAFALLPLARRTRSR